MTSPDDSQTEYVSETFVGLELANTEFVHKEFDGCVFKDCNFSDSVFDHCKFIECEFRNCNLSLMKPKYSRFMDVLFSESKLVGVDWTTAQWSNMSLPAPIGFYKSVLNDSSFYGLYLAELRLEECSARDVDFREGDFHDAQFAGSDFSNALFNSANLGAANFEYAENYFIDLNHSNIKGAKFSRDEAVNLLLSLDIELLD
ncbi:MAG: pentapeptide repeat-containing protein [Reinekea sp.]|jgi:uncharacterized protein YjbI with pentapeptide repeats|nr:pentapeptide repeat-containing protein [Reinekea sp.]MDX1475189.1 pentapeptide repeat-containing protein [Reinekea sp.]